MVGVLLSLAQSIGFSQKAFSQTGRQSEVVDFEPLNIESKPSESTTLDDSQLKPQGEVRDLSEELAAAPSEIADVFETLPGIQVTRTPGAPSFRLQGVPSHQVSVSQNGFTLINPSGIQRNSDFFMADPFSADVLEIYRGSQTAWFGHHSFGGRIELNQEPFVSDDAIRYQFLAGGFDRISNHMKLSKRFNNTSIQIQGFHSTSEGISAASERFGNTEPDGQTHWGVGGRIAVKPNSTSQLTFDLSQTNQQNEIDLFFGPPTDDLNARSEVDHRRFGVGYEKDWSGKDSLVSTFILSYQRPERKLLDEADPGETGDFEIALNSEMVSLGFAQRIGRRESYLQGGYDFDFETVNVTDVFRPQNSALTPMENSFNSKSRLHQAFLRSRFTLASWIENRSAFRMLNFQDKNWEWAGQTQFDFKLLPRRWNLFARVSRGARFPSLYQTEHPQFGQKDLLREVVLHGAIGTEVQWNPFVVSKVEVFENQLNDQIDFSFASGQFENQTGTILGVQWSTRFSPVPQWELNPSYTWTRSKNETLQTEFLRQARHQVQIANRFKFFQRKLEIEARALYLSDRKDRVGSGIVTLEPFWVADILVDFKVHRSLTFFARLENVFDEDYEEISGFGVPGRSLFVGTQAQF